MWADLPLFPVQASAYAKQVDALYFFLIAVSFFFSALIFGSLIYFAIRHRRKDDSIPKPIVGSVHLEVVWSVIPFLITLVMFGWGAKLYLHNFRPPPNALNIFVVAKQWMWQIQHPGGRREINELHVPLGRPVKLTMATEDVIHSFYVPAFRVKMDLMPGRYTQTWFEATREGVYHLFCAEYCGTKHSQMTGRVVVTTPAQYERWLEANAESRETPVATGRRLFQKFACNTCHRPDSNTMAPVLIGLFGKSVRLQDQQVVTADEEYIRESILNPAAKLVAGYQPVMPSFQGQITEEEIVQIIAYIRSLGNE